ncbi:MAG: multidrug effflux MFS transporter [Alphaproteobacteria bacterium]
MSQPNRDPGLTDPSIAASAADPELIAGAAAEHQVQPTARGFPVLLTALVSFSALSVDLILPALPNLIGYFKSDVPTAQLTVSVFIVGFAVAQLAYGSLSDRFGRRPTLLIGLAVYLIASLACTLADSMEQLIVGRFFQALGACSGIVVGRAIVRDVYGPKRAAKVLAYVGMVMGLVPAAAPILGGYLTVWFSWRATFIALAVFSLAVLLGVKFVLRETNLHRDPTALQPRRMAENFWLLLRSRPYMGYLLTMCLSYCAMFSFISMSSFVLNDHFHIATEDFGPYFSSLVIGYITGSMLAGRFTARVGTTRMILIGTILEVVAGGVLFGFVLANTQNIYAVLLPVMLLFCGVGLVVPNALSSAIGPYPRMAGAASALLGFIQAMMGATLSMVVARLHDGTPMAMAVAVFASACLAFVCFYALIWRREGHFVAQAPY